MDETQMNATSLTVGSAFPWNTVETQITSKLAAPAVGKGDKGPPSSGMKIFVPPCQPEFIAPAPPRPRHRDDNASRAASAAADQGPTTQLTNAAGDNHSTTDSEEDLLPVARRRGEATASQSVSPPAATADNKAKGVVADNKQSAPSESESESESETHTSKLAAPAVGKGDKGPPSSGMKIFVPPCQPEFIAPAPPRPRHREANASQTIPTAPSVAARPARATPALAGNSGPTASKKQREGTFCDRLLSCFGLCS